MLTRFSLIFYFSFTKNNLFKVFIKTSVLISTILAFEKILSVTIGICHPIRDFDGIPCKFKAIESNPAVTCSPEETTTSYSFVLLVSSCKACPYPSDFSISEMKVPLLLLSEKGPLRFAVWTSPDLNKLHFKTQNENYTNLFGDLFNPIMTWLMRTNNEKSFYFRSVNIVNKKKYSERNLIT